MNKRVNGQGCYSWTTLKISNPNGMGKKKTPNFDVDRNSRSTIRLKRINVLSQPNNVLHPMLPYILFPLL